MEPKHTIESQLAQGTRRLAEAAAVETPRLDAELLLAHTLGLGRAALLAHAEKALNSAQAARYTSLIERRARGEPLAYIVGYKDFWTLRLKVTPAVLVPRPETELLVEGALARIVPMKAETQSENSSSPGAHLRGRGDGDTAIRVVDLGTGSGAIALALASERPKWHVTATDESEEALAVARANAAALNLNRVEFLQGRWFEPLAGRRFHLIVSNPPYIAADDPALTHPALRHEPQRALTPGADGLACLRAIIREAPEHLAAGGWLLLEHGAAQAADVAQALVLRGFHHVTSRRDLAGHERSTYAQWH